MLFRSLKPVSRWQHILVTDMVSIPSGILLVLAIMSFSQPGMAKDQSCDQDMAGSTPSEDENKLLAQKVVTRTTVDTSVPGAHECYKYVSDGKITTYSECVVCTAHFLGYTQPKEGWSLGQALHSVFWKWNDAYGREGPDKEKAQLKVADFQLAVVNNCETLTHTELKNIQN